MSKFKIISRKNIETNAMEDYVLTTGKIISLESKSKTTSKNGKHYGFFNAEIDGRMSSGIAYDAVVNGRDMTPGTEVQVEILKADALAGHNNRWKLSLSTTEDISSNITDFLKGL